jgi:hypothetical protein
MGIFIPERRETEDSAMPLTGNTAHVCRKQRLLKHDMPIKLTVFKRTSATDTEPYLHTPEVVEAGQVWVNAIEHGNGERSSTVLSAVPRLGTSTTNAMRVRKVDDVVARSELDNHKSPYSMSGTTRAE